MNMMQYKEVFDEVHGYIKLTPLALAFCDTPEFQRLAFIKQLGSSSFVFPSADHTRKAHSFGCYHLSRTMAEHLRAKYPHIVNNRDIELIGIAGLLHDIGHGPFSHVFDNLLSSVPGVLSHELRGCAIIKNMVSKYNIPMTGEELEEITKMIVPPKQSTRNWKYQIVSGTVDADRCDYIVRDSRNVGIVTPFCLHNVHRIINHMTIENNELVFSARVQRDIRELLLARQALHEKVYQHRVSTSVERMIINAISLADPKMENRNEIVQKLDVFLLLTDAYIMSIWADTKVPKPARDLINRIFTRDLYKVKDTDYEEHTLLPENTMETEYIGRWIGMDTGEIHPMKKVKFTELVEINEDQPYRMWRVSKITV